MLTLLTARPPVDSGDVGVGVFYLIVIAVGLWLVFGKHDDGDRD